MISSNEIKICLDTNEWHVIKSHKIHKYRINNEIGSRGTLELSQQYVLLNY